MTRFVERGNDGRVIGHYANEQEYATEELPDDHPDILAYEANKGKPPLTDRWQIRTYVVVRRIADAGKAAEGRTVLEADDEMYLRFLTVPGGFVWNDDEPLVQGILAIGLDPAVILAREEA